MAERIYHVLFLCTGNSARSVMAECALDRWGQGKFTASSAGSQPKGRVHPLTLEVLRQLDYRTGGLRSKSWDEFAGPDAAPLDFVFTVCDSAAAEVCPAWPGQPMSAHWGVPDPAAFVGPPEQQRRRFRDAYFQLERRIQIFASLPLAALDRLSLQRRLSEIGRAEAATEAAS
jgi:arsenate reductase